MPEAGQLHALVKPPTEGVSQQGRVVQELYWEPRDLSEQHQAQTHWLLATFAFC